MDANKALFIKRANQIGVLDIRKRNEEDGDKTGWDAIEIVLNNGEIYVISGEQFGQGEGEDGIWVDTNYYIGEVLKKTIEKSRRDRSSVVNNFFQDYNELVK